MVSRVDELEERDGQVRRLGRSEVRARNAKERQKGGPRLDEIWCANRKSKSGKEAKSPVICQLQASRTKTLSHTCSIFNITNEF